MMNRQEFRMNRRQMIKGLGLGSMAFLFPGFAACRSYTAQGGLVGQNNQVNFQKVTGQSEVSLVKGNDRRDNIFAALKHIEDDIMASLEGKKRILVKPNFVSTSIPLSATHADEIRGILDFLRPRWKGPIVVGESTATRKGTMDGFINFGYLPLEKEYGIKLSDLNEQSYVTRYVVTLSLKNILLGAPVNDYKHNDKRNLHLTRDRSKNSVLHYNMFSLAQEIYPDLGVIDGFEAMEGNGPTRGTPFDARVALASLDPLALDTLATKIMGFDPAQILYLSSMNMAGMGQGDPDKIKTVGTDLQDVQYHFKPHISMVEPYGLG